MKPVDKLIRSIKEYEEETGCYIHKIKVVSITDIYTPGALVKGIQIKQSSK